MASDKLYLGIDLGGTKIFTGLVSAAGEIIAQDYRKTRAKKGLQVVLQRLTDSAVQVMQNAGVAPGDVQAVGLGAPGPVNLAKGVVVSPPNLPGWEKVPLRDLLEKRLEIPTFLENDANAAALGEYCFGAGRGSKQMIYITVSTGIGGGFILDGKLYHGADGVAAEIGHMTILPHGPHCGCGNQGCLEALASGTAIAREGRALLLRNLPTRIAELANQDPKAVSAKLVAEAAQLGDPRAEEIIHTAMDYLGIGVANLVNLLNPELVVIGGSLTKLGETLFNPVRHAINRRTFPIAARRVQVVPAELGGRVGVCGAAAVAIRALDRP